MFGIGSLSCRSFFSAWTAVTVSFLPIVHTERLHVLVRLRISPIATPQSDQSATQSKQSEVVRTVVVTVNRPSLAG